MVTTLDFDRSEMLEWLPKNGVCAELGVDKGDYSKLIIEKNNPSRLFLIDSWENMLTSDSADLQHSKKIDLVKNLFGQNPKISILKKNTNDALNDFEEEYFDWIYIDADHHYQPCLNDLTNWSKKVKTKGFICGHDYIIKPKKGFGVNEAVTDFLTQTSYKFFGVTNEPNFKSFVIQKL